MQSTLLPQDVGSDDGQSGLHVEEQTHHEIDLNQSEPLPAGDEPQPDAVLDAAEVAEEEARWRSAPVLCGN